MLNFSTTKKQEHGTKKLSVVLSVILFTLSVVVIACGNPQDTGDLIINLGGGSGNYSASAALDHWPPEDAELADLIYEVTLTGPSGQIVERKDISGDTTTMSFNKLSTGYWTVKVEAFSDGELYAYSFAACTLKRGKNNVDMMMQRAGIYADIKIEVTSDVQSVARGIGGYAFSADTFGNSPDKADHLSYKWSVEGKTSSGTKISDSYNGYTFPGTSGVYLTVGPDETAVTLTLKAESVNSLKDDQIFGTYTVSVVNAPVKLSIAGGPEKSYQYLAEAFGNIQDNDIATITVCANINDQGALSITGTSKNITIVSQGNNTIQLGQAGSLFIVNTGVTLRLGGASSGELTLRGITNMNAALILVDGGDLELNNNAVITGNKNNVAGGGVKVDSTGTFTMTGGAISENQASQGGAVLVAANCTFTMSGGNITGNSATSTIGGGMMISGGTFTMSGGTITGNNAATFGGGVSVSNNATFTMSAGNISGNNASNDGGGVYVDGTGTFAMSGGTIGGTGTAANTADYGGGVYIDGGDFTMSGSAIIQGNTATSDGGGVYVDGTGQFYMNSGTIARNSADNGGGVYVANGSFWVAGGTIGGSGNNGNTATNGAGVYHLNGTFTLDDVSAVIQGNKAILGEDGFSFGGGVYVAGGDFEMYFGTIKENSAYAGGGVYVTDTGTFYMNNGIIEKNNSAGGYGGGVSVWDGNFDMSGGSIDGNSADYGGGVYVYTGTFTMSGGYISGTNANAAIHAPNIAPSGSGVALYVEGSGTAKFSDGTTSIIIPPGISGGEDTSIEGW